MISMKQAREAFKGLSGMPGIPNDKPAIELRITALKDHSRSEGHAARVIKHLRETNTYFPSIQAIIEGCQNSPDDETIVNSRNGCRVCNGQGFVIVYGPLDTTAAWRCIHNGKQPPDSFNVPPAVQAHYQQEAAEAEYRRTAFMARIGA